MGLTQTLKRTFYLCLVLIMIGSSLGSVQAEETNTLENGVNDTENQIRNFDDVPETYWSYTAIQWSNQNGLVDGEEDEENGEPVYYFHPEENLTFDQFVVMLTRYLENLDPDEGNPYQHWSFGAYESLKPYQIDYSFDGDDFDVTMKNLDITRIDLAYITYQIVHGHKGTKEQVVQWMYENGLASGYTGELTYEAFGADNTLTRAEAAVFLWNMNKKGINQIKDVQTYCNFIELYKKGYQDEQVQSNSQSESEEGEQVQPKQEQSEGTE